MDNVKNHGHLLLNVTILVTDVKVQMDQVLVV